MLLEMSTTERNSTVKEISFVIPVSGVIRIDLNSITVTLKRSEISIPMEFMPDSGQRLSLEPGQTTYDLILEAAREIVGRRGFNRFTAAQVYAAALEHHPELKRNSFMARVISATPDHPSFKHFASKRDYFSRTGPGFYALKERYLKGGSEDDEPSDVSSMSEMNGSKGSPGRQSEFQGGTGNGPQRTRRT